MLNLYIEANISAFTCDGQSDCVRGGPASLGVVCLKPEVVLAAIAQLHARDLDATASLAARVAYASTVRQANHGGV